MARSRKTKTGTPTEPDEAAADTGAGPAEATEQQDVVDGRPQETDTGETPDTEQAGTAEERPQADAVEAEVPAPDPTPDEAGPDAPAPDPEPQPVAAPAPRRGGFLVPALGGVVAAGLGFALAVYVLPKVWVPDVTDEDMAALSAEIKTQDGRIGALATDVQALTSNPAAAADEVAALDARLSDEFSRLGSRQSAAEEQLGQLATQLDALSGRLAELEKCPVEGGAASATALEAFGREMDQLRQEIDAQRANAVAAQDNIAAMTDEAAARLESAQKDAERQREMAEDAARQSAIRSAVGRLQAALESGAPLEKGLADLTEAGIDVPPSLSEQAHGVPSLAALREAFPPAARGAIAASLKEQSDGSMWDRVTAFARSQSGARSLSPRAGDDPDAVLSRAEAALGVGDLATAISEIGSLSEDGQARMAEWTTLAERRLAAVDAVAAMAAEYR
ncbi:MAG: hypothetical protein WBB85_19860 [Albidovulum sp.]|uniref:COG4223 family protein n=1 Tax=Albidovulum sp. TaxID=1872424 RepID=UPI003CBD15E7